jgi:hypothetical protein
MKKPSVKVGAILILLVVLLGGLVVVFFGRFWVTKHSEAATTRAAELRDEIRAELKALGDHPWAGEYYEGDGMGVNVSLMLAPKAGYLFEWHGCMGLYDRNYGKITDSNGRLRLSFTFRNVRRGFQGIAPEFNPVAWGERKYLIPADGVVGFCNAVNDGSEPRTRDHGFFLLRRGDAARPVTGPPAVPEQFRTYLRDKTPIEAHIVAVGAPTTRPSLGDWKFKDTPVTLDVGTKNGLLPGMQLYVTEPRDLVENVTVTKVEADTSTGVMTQIGEEEAGPKVGWRLSTRLPWLSPAGEAAAPVTPKPAPAPATPGPER